MVKAQEWLDENYPREATCIRQENGKNHEDYGKKRKEITYLNINEQSLTGSLNLVGFDNLSYLFTVGNKLTDLKIENGEKIRIIYCFDNQLTNLDFLKSLNPENVTDLDISPNAFPAQDLSCLAKFTNLEELKIGNFTGSYILKKKFDNYHNRFYGSLEPLKNMSKLKLLQIDYNNLDSGLEYLPDSLEKFYCEGTKLEKELSKYKRTRGLFSLTEEKNELFNYAASLKRWKKVNLSKSAQQKLEEQIKLLEVENERLIERFTILKTLITENERQIKEQKNKITQAYLYFFNEEQTELIQKLIDAHKELTKAKKEKLPSIKCEEKCLKIKLEVLNKLGEEIAEKTQLILTDFEELYSQEWNLQNDLEEKATNLTSQQVIKKAIEENQQTLHNLTININVGGNLLLENINASNSNLAIQAPVEEINKDSWLVGWLKNRPILDQGEIEQINNFLQVKQAFLTARQQTIKELQECCNKLETFINGKYAVFLEVGNAVSGIGGAIPVTTFGIPQVIGEAVKSISNLSKIKISKKRDKEFQLSLGNEEVLIQLDNTYKSLTSMLDISKEDKPFSNKYKVFDVVIKNGVWEGRSLNPERMEKVIVSLSQNLELLKDELAQEKRQFKEISSELEQTTQIIYQEPIFPKK